MDWDRAEQRHSPDSIVGRVFQPLTRLINIRKSHSAFGGNKTQVIDTGSERVFGYIHWHHFQGLLVLANFSEQPQMLEMARFRTYGLKANVYDLVKDEDVNLGREYSLGPYQFLWLVPK